MRLLLGLYFVAILISVGAQAAPELQRSCQSLTQPLPWRYCVWKTKGSRSHDVLYHLHGATLDENVWGDDRYYTGLVRQQWEDTGVTDAPVVVSLTFGPHWLLVPRNELPTSGLLEFVLGHAIPGIESGLPFVAQRRLLVGESMGGFNAAQIALKAPSSFSKVAILCPAIADISPFATEAEVEAFVTKTGAKRELIDKIRKIGAAFIPNAEAWEKVAPLGLAEKLLGPTSPPLYLSCGTYDEYGFFGGTRRFASIGHAKGAKVQWRPLYGGHCAVDAASLARFLTARD